MTAALVGLSLLGTVAALVFRLARSRVPPLPDRIGRAANYPVAVLIQPVIEINRHTVEALRAWVASAASYPGSARVVWSTIETAAPILRTLASEYPDLEIRTVVVRDEARSQERGADKAHRLAAGEDWLDQTIGANPCVVLFVDADVVPVDVRALQRLATAAPAPGWTATVSIPPLRLGTGAPAWCHLQRLQARSMDQLLAIGDVFFGHLQGPLQGCCSVFWREDLQKLGGWSAVASFLGEDVALGVLAARAGLRTQLFDPAGVLETETAGGTLFAYLAQQKRWGVVRRTCVREIRWSMLVGLPLKLPVLTGSIALAVSPSAATMAAALAAWAVAGANLPRGPIEFLLLPAEEFVTVLFHLLGRVSRRVTYGPWSYRIDGHGRVVTKDWSQP